MSLFFQLVVSGFRVHKVRLALTILAVALSASLVVAVTGGYASAYAAALRMLVMYMGTSDAQITRKNEPRGGIDQALAAEIARDPAVKRVDVRLEVDMPLLTSDGRLLHGRAAQLIGVDRPHDISVESLRLVQGRWFESSAGDQAVIDQVASQRLGVGLGESFLVGGVDRKLKLQVVGVIHKPTILAGVIQTVYLPLQTLQGFVFPDRPHQVSRILIDLVPGADEQAFAARWQEKLSGIDPLLTLRLASDSRRQMDRNLQGLGAMSYLGSSVSLASAAFIVLATLSIGVAEKQRTLAMLRAIGALRSQLAWLVLIEALVMAIVGVILGVPLGVVWVKLLAWKFDYIFTAGGVISGRGMIFAAGGSVVAALAAALLPAINAMRVSPLEAMTPLARPMPGRRIILISAVGLLLLCLDPLILFGPVDRNIRFYGHFIVGLPAIIIGLFLISPLVVRIIEFLLAPIVAAVFRLRRQLLTQQLSGDLWRAAATASALMIGLAVLVVGRLHGASAIIGWKLPEKFPDIFIFSSPGLSESQRQKLQQASGIVPGQIMPIAIASPELGASIFGIAGAALLPDATMFFGVDPDQALRMLDLDFRQGNARDAAEMLKQGRHVIVTQEFRQLRNLGLGDKLPLKTRRGLVEFTIAGVVWSPGIDVIASMYDLGRQFEQRTVASLFGSIDDAREYFGAERIHLLAANLQPGVQRQQLLEQIREQLGGWGLEIGDVRQIKHGIQQTLFRMLLLVSTVAYSAMIIASLGVANTVMASVRSRRWQFGVLRSLGLTSGQLLRLVLAEALMLGIAAAILGLAGGLEMTMDARRATAVFVGYKPPLVVSWGDLLTGMLAVTGVSVLASLWPAVRTAFHQPLMLLQAGRAAT